MQSNFSLHDHTLESDIKRYIKVKNLNYCKIETSESLQKIHNLFFKKNYNCVQPNLTAVEQFYFGWHLLKHKGIDFRNIGIEYLLCSSNAGNHRATNSLGYFYQKWKNNESALFYFQLAANHGNLSSMSHLGKIYLKNKNYDLMKKYFGGCMNSFKSRTIPNLLTSYYNSHIDDLSFIEFFSKKGKLNDYIERRLASLKVKLTSKTHLQLFATSPFTKAGLKEKQYIYRKTGVFPCIQNYSKYRITFMEMLSLSSSPSCKLTKDVMLKIAGNLFTLN